MVDLIVLAAIVYTILIAVFGAAAGLLAWDLHGRTGRWYWEVAKFGFCWPFWVVATVYYVFFKKD